MRTVIGSTFFLAMGIALLIPVRMSDVPESMGVLVFIATLLVAAACAMHLSASSGSVSASATIRAILVIAAWSGMLLGAGWAMSRAPGSELVVSMMVAPPLIGLAGVVHPPAGNRWHAAPFLSLAVGLALLVFPVWLGRLNG